jgi:uncharacterized protein (DUF488 family)
VAAIDEQSCAALSRTTVLLPLTRGVDDIGPKDNDMQRSFYTIGYQSSRVEDFLAALHLARVEMLIDVRDVPLSRKRGFSKTALAAFLEKHGIAYAHLKGLGDPKPGREAARAGQYDQFRCIFGKHMATEVAQRDLGRAVNLIQTRPCCLMCFEQEHSNCHRSIVAHHIVEQTGMRLHHLSIADLISVHERPSYPARPAIA